MMLRKTKIICTLGPAVDNEDMIRALIRTGMNAARFNFSHGSHEEHLNRLNLLKSVRDSMGRPVAAILDTKGPEIRIRSFENQVHLPGGGRLLHPDHPRGAGEREPGLRHLSRAPQRGVCGPGDPD